MQKRKMGKETSAQLIMEDMSSWNMAKVLREEISTRKFHQSRLEN